MPTARKRRSRVPTETKRQVEKTNRPSAMPSGGARYSLEGPIMCMKAAAHLLSYSQFNHPGTVLLEVAQEQIAEIGDNLDKIIDELVSANSVVG